MKRLKKLKAPSSVMMIIILLIGFGLGYTTKEFGEVNGRISHPEIPTSALRTSDAISVCFTPNRQCQSQIIDEIEKAQKSIFVQAYSFTDKEIATALANAAKRGVAVKVLLDKSNRRDERSAKDILIQDHIPLRFDAPSGIAHNKIIIIDETTIISGSYNFSAAAYKRNTENLLVISNPTLAHQYIQNWQARWRISE